MFILNFLFPFEIFLNSYVFEVINYVTLNLKNNNDKDSEKKTINNNLITFKYFDFFFIKTENTLQIEKLVVVCYCWSHT